MSESTTEQAEQRVDDAPLTLKSVTDQAISVGRDIKEKAGEIAGASVEALKDQASEFVGAAKGIASETGERLQNRVSDQRDIGATFVGNIAKSMQRAAGEFDADVPLAATYIRRAATQVEGVADAVREKSFNDLVADAQDFARRQPTAFLGLAVLAGFGVVRFLKSSGAAASAPSDAKNYTARADTLNAEF